MNAPSVLIDLSPVVRGNGGGGWDRVELVVNEWLRSYDPHATFLGVADNSLWHHLDPRGRRSLTEWRRAGWARTAPWADTLLLDLAEQYPEARIVTSDLFRDLRRAYPWLQRTGRLVAPRFAAGTVEFRVVAITPIPEHEISLRFEETALKPRGVTSPETREALDYEWVCENPDCALSRAVVIDEDPAFVKDVPACPECRIPARRAGRLAATKEIVLSIKGTEVHRALLPHATYLTFGRRRGVYRFDVSDLLEERIAARISRDHLTLSVRNGRVIAEDLGSANGSVVEALDGSRVALVPHVGQFIELGQRVRLAGEALDLRVSGRRRVRGQPIPQAHDRRPAAESPTSTLGG